MVSELESTSLGELVSLDYRAAAIFERFGLDYCCGGTRTLGDACRQRGVSVGEVAAELETLDASAQAIRWEDRAELVDHIVKRHHSYVRMSIPLIEEHLVKVAAVHGGRHPELMTVQERFSAVGAELIQHMAKEEVVLFPYIRALAEAVERDGTPPPDMFGTVQNPIRMMESEHEEAGFGLNAVRELAHGYTPPDDACSSYRSVLRELAAFEQDLHEHVHLENTVLFPAAIELEQQCRLMARELKCRQLERT